jgi:hypothetical protein
MPTCRHRTCSGRSIRCHRQRSPGSIAGSTLAAWSEAARSFAAISPIGRSGITSGRFQARAEIDDLLLKYLPDWPAAEHVRLAADFVNTSLRVGVDAGQVKGARLNHASAEIGDLGEPLLELEAGSARRGADLLALLKATPIGQRFGVQLLGVDVGGQGKVNFHSALPIKHAEQLALDRHRLVERCRPGRRQICAAPEPCERQVAFQPGWFRRRRSGRNDGRPTGEFRSGGRRAFTADPKHEVEATLGASLPAALSCWPTRRRCPRTPTTYEGQRQLERGVQRRQWHEQSPSTCCSRPICVVSR